MFLAILRRERRRLVESATGSACLNAVCGYFIGFFFFIWEQIRDKSVRLAIFYNTYLLIFVPPPRLSAQTADMYANQEMPHLLFMVTQHRVWWGAEGGKFFDLKTAVFNTESVLTVPASPRAEIGKCSSKRKFGEASQKAHLVAVLGPYKRCKESQSCLWLLMAETGSPTAQQ